jgi:hypothetical protein
MIFTGDEATGILGGVASLLLQVGDRLRAYRDCHRPFVKRKRQEYCSGQCSMRVERVRIKMGEAFDVVGERIQRDWKRIGGSVYEVEWEINLRNHKKENVVVSVIEPIPGDWEVLRETQPHEKLEAHTLRYQVPVPQEGAAKVTYRVRLRF